MVDGIGASQKSMSQLPNFPEAALFRLSHMIFWTLDFEFPHRSGIDCQQHVTAARPDRGDHRRIRSQFLVKIRNTRLEQLRSADHPQSKPQSGGSPLG